MLPAVMAIPYEVPVAAATTRMRELLRSQMTRLPAPSTTAQVGSKSPADRAGPPSPNGVLLPLPATVYMRPAVIGTPQYVPDTAGTTRTLSLSVSAMIRLPE